MILMVDADAALTRMVQRHLEQLLPGVGTLSATNGLQALAIAHSHAPLLRVITLDIRLPLMDGRILGAALRRLAPRAVLVPFTERQESLGFFNELGCETPLLKPTTARHAARQLMASFERSATPLPRAAWFAAMCAQADALLECAGPIQSAGMSGSKTEQDERLRRAQALLQRYLMRAGPAGTGREIAQSLKLIEQCLSA